MNGSGDMEEKPPVSPKNQECALIFSKKMEFAEKYGVQSKKSKKQLPLKSKVRRGLHLAFLDI